MSCVIHMLSSQHYQLQQAVIQIASTPLSASLKTKICGKVYTETGKKIKTLTILILQFSPNVLLEHLPTPSAHSHYFLCFHFNQLEQAKCGNTLFQRQDTISQLMFSQRYPISHRVQHTVNANFSERKGLCFPQGQNQHSQHLASLGGYLPPLLANSS